MENGYGAMTLTNCIVSGNSAASGGGLEDGYGPMTLANCAVDNNQAVGTFDFATAEGGGIELLVGVSRSPAAHSPATRQPASLELITLAVSLPVMALAAGSLSGTTRPPPLPTPRSWVTSPKVLPAPRD